MRILFTSDLRSAAWGGSEELWSQSARRLAEAGADVGALLVRRPTAVRQLEELEWAGCKFHWLAKGVSLIRRVARRLMPGRRVSDVRKWIKATKPDLLVNTLSSSAAESEASLACLECGIPYVLVIQNAAECHWPPDDELEDSIQAFSGARRCCFVSEANRKLTERQLGVRLENAEVVRNPFNVAYGCTVPWPVEDVEARAKFACVARLDPASKGQDLILEVLAQEKWRGRSLSVSLFGSGRNDASLKRLARQYYALSNVEFRGHVTDVERIWAEHHALLMPSRYEGLPLAVVEAMLCGRPCVVTDVAGNREVLEDGKTGFLAAAPTMRHLDEAMERSWEVRAQWRTMGEAGAVAIRRLIPADPVGAFIGLLENVLSERSRAGPAIGERGLVVNGRPARAS